MKTWGKYAFEWTAFIKPELDDNGAVQAFLPNINYQNPQGLALNPYGQGPFCKFRIPSDKTYAGIYLLSVDNKAMYIGECNNLVNRYNDGYGAISPRDCYEGGQPTYCRINHLIYTTVKAGRQIELWFFKTANRPAIQEELVKALKPLWNRKGFMPK